MPGGSKSRHTVTRSLAFVAAVALVVAQPVVTLGAPPGGAAVYRPAVSAHRSPPAPGGRSNAGEPFKVPFDVNRGPRPLPDSTMHSALETLQRLDPQNPFRWRGLEWIPAVFQSACYSTNGLWGPSSLTGGPAGASTPPTEFTIGSLVDGHSIVSSHPSYAQSMAAPSSGVIASSPSTFQNGFQPAPCGAQLLQSF